MDTALIVCLALIVAALAFFIVKLVQSVREENRHDLHHHRLIELQQESDEFFVPGDPLFPQNNDRVPRPVERIVKK